MKNRPSPNLLSFTILVQTISLAMAGTGCQLFSHDADREVYRLIESRQNATLGDTSQVRLNDTPQQSPSGPSSPYAFTPHPVSSEVPAEFKASTKNSPLIASQPNSTPAESGPDQPMAEAQDTPQPSQATTQPTSSPAEAESLLQDPQEMPVLGEPLTLAAALSYAIKNSREYQDAQEDLYLQALALTLERRLWTPRFVSSLQTHYREFPQKSDPDRSMDAVANFAVEQKLPLGGEVVARWVGTMVRDLERHVTNAESGTAIIEANIPLLRGAGLVAYESRFQAERDLIYAVRRFEDFRRSFLTNIAGDYFDLLSTKSSVRNAIANRNSSKDNWQRSQALADAERIIRQEADRARVDYLRARDRVINALESYESSLDEFKIRIGMPTIQAIDVTDEGLDLKTPQVEEQLAIDAALKMRLDLLTTLDRVDDAKRDLKIAQNNLLPNLNLSSSVTYTTKADHFSSFDFREDNETWDVTGELEIPLDRKAERNAYRSAQINLRRAQRGYEQAADRVRLEVRRALRQIRQATFSLMIQEENIRSNEVRREAAQARFEIGELSNRDVVDADNDLRQARDDYANALSTLRQAILQFKLSTGTLRVTEDGYWRE